MATVLRCDVTRIGSKGLLGWALRSAHESGHVEKPGRGEIYLVTENVGVKVDPKGGIGRLQTAPVQGTFQVPVIGN